MTDVRTVAWGLCPACENGGLERPCWQCGFDGPGFKSTIGHITQHTQLSISHYGSLAT